MQIHKFLDLIPSEANTSRSLIVYTNSSCLLRKPTTETFNQGDIFIFTFVSVPYRSHEAKK